MNNLAVIDVGYGDAGKGKLTSYLCDQVDNPLVVRAGAGANCGHTVEYKGVRHVFSSLGSGTLQGAPTYWGPQFRINPIMFMKEYNKLRHFKPEVYVHPDAQLTTPYDVFVNRAVEDHRGITRHGSTGMGIGETVHRIENFESFSIHDCLVDQHRFGLNQIKTEWLPKRFEQLEINPDTSILETSGDRFIQDFNNMMEVVTFMFPEEIFHEHDLIFEGNQGLSLDQHSKDFPHVTRANCGLKDILLLVTESGVDTLPHVHYVTRVYATRHGAGPFKEIENPGVTDLTNSTNKYQENFRYGHLDLDRIKENVEKDENGLDFERTLMVTHCDQAELFDISLPVLKKMLKDDTKADKVLLGYGPEHNNFRS